MKNQGMNGILFGEKIARRGLIGLILLGTIKAVAGYVTGTVVLITDAIATGMDVVTLFGTYMGLKLSKKGAEGGFKYGYYKVETLTALLVAISILYLGVKVLIKNISRFNTVPQVEYPYYAIASVVVAIAFSLHFARRLRQAAKEANSLSLLNNAKEKESDIMIAFIVLIAIIASIYKLPHVESIIGIGMSLIILKVGIESAKDSIFYLLDYWDDPALLKKIERIIQKNAKIVTEIKKIRLRRAGTWIFGEVYVEIPSFADPRDIRAELNHLQEKIKKADRYLKDFIIYFKIPKPDKVQVAIPVREKDGIKSEIAMTPQETKYYLILDIDKKSMQNIRHIPVDLGSAEKITEIVKMLKDQGVDIVVNNGLNSLFYYTLQHIHHIQLYPVFSNIKTAEETVKLLLIDA